MTRIGTGPFPSEVGDEETAGYIRETGKEYGTTTGRPRRIGWLDLDLLDYAHRVNGFTYIALTMLDVLSGVDPIVVRSNGKNHTVEGWTGDISEVRHFAGLPKQARDYVYMIERHIGIPIKLISVGPDRKQMIDRRNER